LIYRITRAGLVPKVDSGGPIHEPGLTQPGVLARLGPYSELELFVYADSSARIADESKLSKSEFVFGDAPQTMKHERIVIESANALVILKTLNDLQRERVTNAVMAGPPQK